MQVMGIIPKKERKKKIEPYLPDANGLHNLDTFKLPNGYSVEDKCNNHHFSASKMFPELAGKLSLDNQKNGDLTSNDAVDKSPPKSSSKALATANNLPSKRSRKLTKKYLSSVRKKQLGLLTDDEAKASLTAAGCRTYSQYAAARVTESHLLTPLVESSDDESLVSSLHTMNSVVAPCSPLSPFSTTDLNELSE